MFDDEDILTYELLSDPPGIEIIDQLERLRYQLWTARPVSPKPTDPGSFHFPVSSAFEITTERLSLPATIGVFVRDSSGDMLADVSHLEEESLDENTYILELGAQIKTYVEVERPIELSSNLLERILQFDQPRDVRVGVRSRHEQPAATVTTTEDPCDMMAAVSSFGSALKSMTPERSYPTLRGHPPNIELGDTLDIPKIAQPPETGVQIEVPESYEAVFTVAPLAYYLGARVVQGSSPLLTTEDGFEHGLCESGCVETGVAQTLKQLFVLDCATRVDGLYSLNLHERNVIEDRVNLDFESLYDRSLSEQIAAYLSVPYTLVEDCIPTWRLSAHVEPVPETIEQLPFVVNDLATVHIVDGPDTESPSVHTPSGQAMARGVQSTSFTRSVAETSTRATAERSGTATAQYVEPQSSDALEQAWIGTGTPIGASKLTKQAFENWFGREKVEGDISITIVVNDHRMNEERDLVNRVYGDRNDLPFDVTICDDLAVAEFRETLTGDHSFLHYIGHVEDTGFKCADGIFDAASLESTGVDSFMLNACDSYEQGLHLVDAGAVGGIVTLNEILNDDAVQIGESVAHLLNAGFPLDVSLTIARKESVFGGQYIIVGAGGLTVTQPQGRAPLLVELMKSDDKFDVEFRAYANDDMALGSIFKPCLGNQSKHFLTSSSVCSRDISKEDLNQLFMLGDIPVRVNESLSWSQSTDIDTLL